MIKIEHNVRYQGGPSKEEMQRRYDLAMEFMKERNLDYLVTQANDGMLSQYVRWFAQMRTAHYIYLLFDKDGSVSVISHGTPGGKAIPFDLGFTNNIAITAVNNACYADSAAAEEAAKLIQNKGCKKIGFIGMNLITAAFYNNLLKMLGNVEVFDVTDDFDYLVAVKSEEELSLLQDACNLHDAIASAVPSLVYAGRLEREFGADLYRLAILAGADEYLSNIMIGSSRLAGPMYALHYQNKIIEEGDALNVLLEVPAISGYYADVHRYYNMGTPAPEMLEVTSAAVELQDYAAGIAKPGIKSYEIFQACNDWLAKNGFEPEIRLCGHGQGYGLVERPYLDAFDNMKFKENMYLSIHPTVKTKGASVSISDNYVITKDGAKRMTKSQRGLIII